MSASWLAGFGYSIVRLLEHRKALQVWTVLCLVAAVATWLVGVGVLCGTVHGK